MADIGKALRVVMAERNLSGGETAQLIGVTQGGVTTIRKGRGNPTITTINQIAKGFNLSTSEFLKKGE